MVVLSRPMDALYAKLGDKVKENVALAPYTSARIGGPADVLITAESADELARIIKLLRKQEIDYLMLGGGSNVLVSDKGVRGVVVLNRARGVRFHINGEPSVTAESGVVISNLANRCAAKGLAGLEWAATVPGTLGGAVYEYEPDETDILADLLPLNITVQIFKALLENAASEQGARMSAMDNATRNAGDMIGRLTLNYNRTRQAMITKELIEIISGAEAI